MIDFEKIKQKGTLLEGDKYDKLWFEYTNAGVFARKLEFLQSYAFIDDNEDFNQGRYDKFADFLKEFNEYALGGKENVKRLHFVKRPLNNYLKMEFYTYLINSKHGQEVRINEDRSLFPEKVYDFVLFDNGNLFLLDFGKNNDRWVGAWRVTDKTAIKEVAAWYDGVYKKSVDCKNLMKPDEAIIKLMKERGIL